MSDERGVSGANSYKEDMGTGFYYFTLVHRKTNSFIHFHDDSFSEPKVGKFSYHILAYIFLSREHKIFPNLINELAKKIFYLIRVPPVMS